MSAYGRRLWSTLASLWPEVRVQLELALPIMLSNACQFLLLTVSTMLSGHNGTMAKVEMDGVALANSMINAFGFTMAAGLATACDTLFSQGLGSNRPSRTGIFLLRALLILNMVALLLTVLYQNFEPIFIYVLRQEEPVAAVAATFLSNFRVGIIFYFNYIIMARYLQAQGCCGLPLIASLSGNALNIGAQGILLALHAHTPRSTAICQASATGLMALIELLYLLFIHEDVMGAWSGFTTQALQEWGSFTLLAISGMFHNSLEVIFWEVGTVFAGMMSSTMLGAQAVLYLSETVLFTAQLGISVVVNHRIGRALGSGEDHEARARLIVRAGLSIVGVFATLLFIILVSLQSVLALPFTSDEEIRQYVQKAVPIVALCIAVDGIECLLAGVLRGCGKQKIGAIIVGCSFYIVGLPISIVLGFVAHLQVIGIWIGTFIAVVTTTTGYSIVLRRISWDEESQKAIERVTSAIVDREISSDSENPSDINSEQEMTEDMPLLQARRNPRSRCEMDLPKCLIFKRVVVFIIVISITVVGNVLVTWTKSMQRINEA